jgi:hypothetical protein
MLGARRVLVLVVVLGLLVLAGSARATGTLDQQQPTVGGEINVHASFWQSEIVTPGITGALDQVDLPLRQTISTQIGLPLIVQIRTVAGSVPSATILSTTTVTLTNAVLAFTAIPLTRLVGVTSGVKFAIVVGTTVLDGEVNVPQVGIMNGDPYAGGLAVESHDGGSTWISRPDVGNDLAFKTYVSTRPSEPSQCKNGDWRAFMTFKNQGDCVSSIAS